MADPVEDQEAADALQSERQFVLALGGFALHIAGATLVTHEKLPVPRFNFVEVGRVSPERQTAFFERALDHYFQRALRPTFRLRPPVPSHLDRGLRSFGFRPRPDPLVLLGGSGGRSGAESARYTVRVADRSELDLVASFWTSERERPEFRSALDTAWSHPNPEERLQPVLARDGEQVVAAALVYRYGAAAGLFAVATQPEARGRGAASDLVRGVLAQEVAGPGARYWITADSPRLRARLELLGFRPLVSFDQYELPPDAVLAMPPLGPAGPPRWRPPR